MPRKAKSPQKNSSISGLPQELGFAAPSSSGTTASTSNNAVSSTSTSGPGYASRPTTRSSGASHASNAPAGPPLRVSTSSATSDAPLPSGRTPPFLVFGLEADCKACRALAETLSPGKFVGCERCRLPSVVIPQTPSENEISGSGSGSGTGGGNSLGLSLTQDGT